MKTNIKPCPFCKGTKLAINKTEDESYFWVGCEECHAAGPQVDVDETDEYEKMDGTEKLYNKMLKMAMSLAVSKWNSQSTGKLIEKTLRHKTLDW